MYVARERDLRPGQAHPGASEVDDRGDQRVRYAFAFGGVGARVLQAGLGSVVGRIGRMGERGRGMEDGCVLNDDTYGLYISLKIPKTPTPNSFTHVLLPIGGSRFILIPLYPNP